MLTDTSDAAQIIAYILISVLCAYSGGRFHQWYKHGMDRDRSFREGYGHGYRALFPLAARNAGVARLIGRETADAKPRE